MNEYENNVATRPQEGGTCWFHAIINGLLMSWRTRKMLKEKIKELGINNSNILPAGICPSKKYNKFWQYIAHRLSGPGKVNRKYKNYNVIKNIKARRRTINPIGMIPRFGNTKTEYMKRFLKSRSGVTGGTFTDLLNIYEKMFGNDFSYKNYGKKKSSLLVKNGPNLTPSVIHDGEEYAISHSYIAISAMNGLIGHAVCGYVSRVGTYRIFDSAIDTSFEFDWTTNEFDKVLLEWISSRIPFKMTKVHRWGIYIRYDRI